MPQNVLGDDLSGVSLPILARIVREESSADGERSHLVRSESPVVLAGLVEEMEVLEYSGARLDRSIYPSSLLYELVTDRGAEYDKPYQGSLRQLLRSNTQHSHRTRLRVESDINDVDTASSSQSRIAANTELIIAFGGPFDQIRATAVPAWVLGKPGTYASSSPDRSGRSRSRSPARRGRQRLQLVYVPLDVVCRVSVCRSAKSYTFREVAVHATEILPRVFTAYPQIDITMASDGYQQYQGSTACSLVVRVSTYRMFIAVSKNQLFKIPANLEVNFCVETNPDPSTFANACRVLAEHAESGVLPEISFGESLFVTWVRDDGTQEEKSDSRILTSGRTKPSITSEVFYRSDSSQPALGTVTHRGNISTDTYSTATVQTGVRNFGGRLGDQAADDHVYSAPKSQEECESFATSMLEYSTIGLSPPRETDSKISPSDFEGLFPEDGPGTTSGPSRLSEDEQFKKKSSSLLRHLFKHSQSSRINKAVADTEPESAPRKPHLRKPGPTPKPRSKQSSGEDGSLGEQQGGKARPRLPSPSSELDANDRKTGLRSAEETAGDYAVPQIEVMADKLSSGLGVVRSHSSSLQGYGRRLRSSTGQPVPTRASAEFAQPDAEAPSSFSTSSAPSGVGQVQSDPDDDPDYDSPVLLPASPASKHASQLTPKSSLRHPTTSYEFAAPPSRALTRFGQDSGRPQLPLPPDNTSKDDVFRDHQPCPGSDLYDDVAGMELPPPPTAPSCQADLPSAPSHDLYDSVESSTAVPDVAHLLSFSKEDVDHAIVRKRPPKLSPTSRGGSLGEHEDDLPTLPFRQSSSHQPHSPPNADFMTSGAAPLTSYDYVERPPPRAHRPPVPPPPVAAPSSGIKRRPPAPSHRGASGGRLPPPLPPQSKR